MHGFVRAIWFLLRASDEASNGNTDPTLRSQNSISGIQISCQSPKTLLLWLFGNLRMIIYWDNRCFSPENVNTELNKPKMLTKMADTRTQSGKTTHNPRKTKSPIHKFQPIIACLTSNEGLFIRLPGELVSLGQ